MRCSGSALFFILIFLVEILFDSDQENDKEERHACEKSAEVYDEFELSHEWIGIWIWKISFAELLTVTL